MLAIVLTCEGGDGRCQAVGAGGCASPSTLLSTAWWGPSAPSASWPSASCTCVSQCVIRPQLAYAVERCSPVSTHPAAIASSTSTSGKRSLASSEVRLQEAVSLWQCTEVNEITARLSGRNLILYQLLEAQQRRALLHLLNAIDDITLQHKHHQCLETARHTAD